MRHVAVLALLIACGEADPAPSPNAPVREPRAQQQARNQTRVEADKPGYLGTLVPRDLAEVTAPFSSTVATINVKLGDRVTKGQALAQLDDRPLREEIAIAAATLKANKAAVAQAAIAAKGAKAKLVREKRAFKENVTSRAEVSAAEFAEREAVMTVAQAAANVEEQKARIAQLNARLTDTNLVSPLDGQVALLYVAQGDRVDEGGAVIRVISGNEVFVKFAIPADKAGTLAAGDPVDIVLDQMNTTTPGVVGHVAPEIDPVAKMILADANLTTPPAKLQPGIDCRIIPKPKSKP